MRFFLIIVGAIGCIAGGEFLLDEGLRAPVNARIMLGVTLLVASATSLVIGLATVDIVNAIEAKDISGHADGASDQGKGSERNFGSRA
jgi:hypothetical protein